MEQIYYGTVGMLLDIICLTLPLLLLLKVKYKPIVFVFIYLIIFIASGFGIPYIYFYLGTSFLILLLFKYKYNVGLKNYFIVVSSFVILFIFDTTCFLLFEDLQLVIISTMYKIYLIVFYKNVLTDKEISLDLIRKQMLSIIGVSVIIILGVLKGVLYV